MHGYQRQRLNREPESAASYDQIVAADDELEDFEHEHEPLVRRLRDMDWPRVPADLRERAWREFQRRTGAGHDGHGPDVNSDDR